MTFTKNLARHTDVKSVEVEGLTVREVLDATFLEQPVLRSYVLDDQGALRQHMIIFIDGEQLRDRKGLGDEVASGATLHVMQALSGG